MSAGFKDLVKGGWHPDKNKSQSFSVRRDVKGANAVAKRLGHGKGDEIIDTSNHSAAPLSTLKDPASFGPPPKHIAAHGAEAANASSRNGGMTGSAVSPPSSRTRTESPSSVRSSAQSDAPPIPSRQGTGSTAASTPISTIAPKLPPRLPPRRDTGAMSEETASPPPPYTETEASEQNGYVNQAAAGRLGRAGVSVPGLGIGSEKSLSPVPPARRQPGPSSQQMDELSSRFKTIGRNGGSNDAAAGAGAGAAPATGTSWAQKQSALKTAESFRRDPSSVSMTDARSAASTANNFRQRHEDKVAAGLNRANEMNQRYGGQAQAQGQGQSARKAAEEEEEEEEERARQAGGQGDVAAAAAGKKKPPPPPAKKSTLVGGGNRGAEGSSPPPIPLASKPR